MKRIVVIFMVLCAIAAALFFIFKEEGKKKLPAEFPARLAMPEIRAKVEFDIRQDIAEAQALLESEEAGYTIVTEEKNSREKKIVRDKKGRKREKIITRTWTVQKLKELNVLLAVEDINDRKIGFVRINPKAKASKPPGYMIDYTRASGVGTDYTVIYPKDHLMLALKRVVKWRDGFMEVVYTPFTNEINSLEMRIAGWTYLRKVFELAIADLRQKAVQSIAFKECVCDVVPWEVALTLAIIEHIDPARFEKGEPIEQLINEVLVVLAANRDVAFKYSVSKANARGLSQFIPATYDSIRRSYPGAQLETDFIDGMSDHINGAKAAILLFDSDLGYLSRAKRESLRKDPEALGKYLAAAYNCGAKRTADAIRKHKNNWEKKCLPETKVYLKKFDAAWKIIFSR